MKIVLLILGIIIALLLLIAFMPLNVIIEYSGDTRVKVFVYGIKLFDSKKPKKYKKVRKLVKSEDNIKQEAAKDVSFEKKEDDGNKMIRTLKKKFHDLREILKLIIEKTKKYAIIKNIEVKYHFGLGDAAITAIFSGFVYGVVNGFAAFLRNYYTIKNQKLDVVPDFDNKIQDFHAKIEILIRVIFFVPALVKLIKLFKEEKEV